MDGPLQNPPVPRSRPGASGGFHATLLALTFVTAAVAGGSVWVAGGPVAESFLDLIRPDYLLAWFLGGLVYAFWALVILGCHEMGHYLACRYYGIPATLPYFIPGPPPLGSFGAVIRIRGAIPDRKALFDVAAAGPLAGFAVTLPVLVYGMLHAEAVSAPTEAGAGAVYLGRPVLMVLLDAWMGHSVDVQVNACIGAGWVGLLVTSLNLFPVGQLDGGHAAYAISRRFHRVTTGLTLLGLGGVILAQAVLYRQFPFYVIWFAILLWMRDRHPRLIDEQTPLGAGRKLVAVGLLVVFALCFILVPLYAA